VARASLSRFVDIGDEAVCIDIVEDSGKLIQSLANSLGIISGPDVGLSVLSA
jgi:hypothetical protein